MIQTNRKRGPRMDRILVMMFAENISMKELATRLGLTVQAVNDYFHNDDCKLSRLEEITDACGYSLKWELVKKENQR